MKSILYEFTPSELQILLDTSDSYSDLLRKVGLNPKGGNPATLKKLIKEYNLDESQLDQNRLNLYSRNSIYASRATTLPLEDILNNNIEKPYSSAKLLRRLVKEGYKDYKCEICGLNEWQNKPITLQLNHINGDHFDNQLDNLQILCPNCHSQTDNFAGKNINYSKNKRQQQINKIKVKELKIPPISRSDLKDLIRTIPFVQIGKQFGVSDNAVRKWCDKYKLPRKVSEIKKYNNEEWEKI